MRRGALALLVALSSCGQCGGPFTETPSFLCDQPFQVGPDGTAGECYLGSVCLPTSMATCTGNDCCHSFCSVEGCPNQSACISLTPDQFPDGGPPGCECVDGGGCVCAGDGGSCLRPSCLSVCAEPS